MEYRDQFGKDILPVIMPFMASMIEGVSTIAADAGELTLANIAEALEGRSMDVLLPMFQAEFVDLVVNVTWAMAKFLIRDLQVELLHSHDALFCDLQVGLLGYALVLLGLLALDLLIVAAVGVDLHYVFQGYSCHFSRL